MYSFPAMHGLVNSVHRLAVAILTMEDSQHDGVEGHVKSGGDKSGSDP